eukprot:2749526-Prymnesium_polylepis.1
MSVKAGVWHLQHDGTLGAFATDVLVNKLNHCLDDKHGDWVRWADFEVNLASPPKWISQARKIPIVGWFAREYLTYRLGAQHDIAYGFLTVHNTAESNPAPWSSAQKLSTGPA